MGQKIQNSDVDIEKLEKLILRLGWESCRRTEHGLMQSDLTLPQFIALRFLYSQPGAVSMSELAKATNQVLPTMTGIINRLVKQGWVLRERDAQDRRSLKISLSPEGSERIDRMVNMRCSALNQFLQALSAEEREQMVNSTERLLDIISLD